MNQPQRLSRDDLDKIVVANINEFGWHCVNIIEDNGCPPWSYTIGLYETWNHPELIVIGRSRATSHAMSIDRKSMPMLSGFCPRSGRASAGWPIAGQLPRSIA